MKTKEMAIRSVIVFTSCLLFSCFNDYDCNTMESNIKKGCKGKSMCRVKLDTLYDFKWNELYVVEGPIPGHRVREIVDVGYVFNMVLDDSRRYIFLNNKKVVYESTSYCYDLGFAVLFEDDYVRYTNDRVLSVREIDTEGFVHYDVTK